MPRETFRGALRRAGLHTVADDIGVVRLLEVGQGRVEVVELTASGPVTFTVDLDEGGQPRCYDEGLLLYVGDTTVFHVKSPPPRGRSPGSEFPEDFRFRCTRSHLTRLDTYVRRHGLPDRSSALRRLIELASESK